MPQRGPRIHSSNYYTTRQELLAIVKAIDHVHPFLYGQKFTIRTNHASLQWLLNFKNPEGQIARWLDKLQTYDFCIVYHTGRSYQNADVLSHRPCFDTNCKHCQNQEEKHATENAIGMPNDCVVNVTQAHVSEGPQSPSASLPRELSPLQFRTHQMERKTIYHILGWKEAGKRPEWASITYLNFTTKVHWAQGDSLAVKEGVLYHWWELTKLGKVTWQLVLPKGLYTHVLKQLCDSPVGGNLGVCKTLAKVSERFYWIHCHRDIEEWCRRCNLFETRKGPKVKQRSPVQLYNVGSPWSVLPLMSWDLGQKPTKVTSTSSLRWTILVNGLKRMHSQIRKWSLLLMSLCPSSLVGLVSLVSYTLTKAKISNRPCSRRFAPRSGPIRPGQWHYIHSPMAWWIATTGL